MLGMTQKSDVKFRKIAMILEAEVVQRLDTYAKRKFKCMHACELNADLPVHNQVHCDPLFHALRRILFK